MDRNKLQVLAKELAKDVKTEKDLGELGKQLVKSTVEAALNTPHAEHLVYAKHGRVSQIMDVGTDGNAKPLGAGRFDSLC